MLTVFDDTIADTFSNKKTNISPFFTTQSLLVVQKNIRLNSAQYFVLKVPN